MPKQDKRVKASEEDIEMFLVLASGNRDELISELLEDDPSLVYAVDEIGNTALSALIFSGQRADLATARIIMNYNPDLTMRNNMDYNAFSALRTIDDPILVREFARLLIPGIQFEALPPELTELESEFGTNDVLEANRNYANTPGVKENQQTLNRMLDGKVPIPALAPAAPAPAPVVAKKEGILKSVFKMWTVQEGEYDNKEFNNGNFNSLFRNLDDEKRFSQMDAQVTETLKGFSSFSLTTLESSSMGEFPILIIPNELAMFSIEQISNFVGDLHDYLLGSNNA